MGSTTTATTTMSTLPIATTPSRLPSPSRSTTPSRLPPPPPLSITSRLHPPPNNAPPGVPLPPLPASPITKSPSMTISSPSVASSPKSRSLAGVQPTVRRAATMPLLDDTQLRLGSSPPTPTLSSAPAVCSPSSAIPIPRAVKTISASSVPTLSSPRSSSLSAIPSPGGRSSPKTISIEDFPHPPRRLSQTRLSNLPPSPLSNSLSPDSFPSSGDLSGRLPLSPRNSSLRLTKTRTPVYTLHRQTSNTSLKAPSLLSRPTSIEQIKANPAVIRSRSNESLLSMPSTAVSNHSSQRDSLTNTENSAIDDVEDEAARVFSHRKSVVAHRDSTAPQKDGKGNVLVSVRVRPDAGGGDGGAAVEGEWMVDGRRSLVSYKGKEGGEYVFDNVFSAYDNNARVYDSAAKRLVRRVMEGYNGTVFAYGMTGTGKTFSMQGTAASPGVIPLAIADIFSYIRENPNREFLLRVSYLEIYNEKIHDLLNGSSSAQQQEEIKLREDSRRGVYATPLKEEIVQSPNQLLRVIAIGDQARKVAGTKYNARSSRSHAVVQIVVESRERLVADNSDSPVVAPGGVLVSTLSLIDLAGSEKAAENKERRTEGSHINKSLLTLGTVIARLSGDDENKDGTEKVQKHLPYRDSKLTRLLQPALSGDSLVSILCTVQLSSAATSASTTTSHTNETLNTLKFASRAKNNIISRAKRNVTDMPGVDAGSRALLDRYRIEIADLRQKLEEQSRVKEAAESNHEPQKGDQSERLDEQEQRWRDRRRDSEQRHEEQMLEMQLARTALKERISHLNRLILSSKSIGVNSARASTISNAWPYSYRGSTSSAVELANSRRQSNVSVNSQSDKQPSTSAGSMTVDITPPDATSPMEIAVFSEGDEAEADCLESVTGTASKDRQIRTLQADLSDKNRYIATLEKRLIQAKRNSNSKQNTASSPQRDSTGDVCERNTDAIIKEKDREIEELRARLDDQMRMVTALRSAARKRDMLDGGVSGAHPAFRSEATCGAAVTTGVARRGSGECSPTTASRLATRGSQGSRTSSGSSVNFSRPPLTPVAVLSDDPASMSDKARSLRGRRKTVDEMTKLLDEMIQEKVDGGQVVRGDKGALQVKRDTVVTQRRDAVLGATEQAV